MDPTPLPSLHRWQVLLMAFATGVAVASNYYAQPLLHTMAGQFGVPFGQIGIVVTAAQLSYAAGLILLVPLGDLFERRRLIVVMSLLSACGLVISALAPSLPWLLLGTALTGLFSVVAQVLVPFAATLAEPQHRGRVVGTLMSGLLLGILLARTVAGGISSLGSWRWVYAVAAVVLVSTTLALWRGLPRFRHGAGLGYFALLRSIGTLFAREPVFRHRTLLGACSFAMFAMFWTPLAFLLAQHPYGYTDATIGLFGLVGAAGTLAAGIAGRMADRGQSGRATAIALVLLLASWLPLGVATHSLAALLVGVLALDLAAQLLHVSNQNVVYALQPDARNRLNAGYMTGYFIGGSLGSLLSAQVYQRFGWTGVCLAGASVGVLALLLWLPGALRARQAAAKA
ncbi:MFS transporter [Stenotrophomonas sp. 24(2023)]|uniref:MFS transporter n=1 Tax=Stenotrophomonas sp. 24(2023) TaxID=3068324 RepID=UPI0027E0FA10|nr:MFS transporter [Stenotrophomonas sp. 24(2023)]WMJ71378.1 MFS transporter [Stenotrophomonas sp. 24(2023)]